MGSERQELAAVVAAIRAHVEFEQVMATPGLPRVQRPEPAPEADAPDPGAAPASTGAASAAAVPTGELVGLDPEQRVQKLQVLAEQAVECTDCVLHEQRNRNVFARGNPDAELVFVGEGPGRDEDRSGLPFVGAAGQLLDKMVVAMGYDRDDVYICNVVKCRPPENRTPRPEEALACARFLKPQIALVQPKLIVALGRCAAEHLGVAPAQGSWRGRWGSYAGVPVMPTYHPAYLLRSPEFKRVVWQDLQNVMGRLGKRPPQSGGGGRG